MFEIWNTKKIIECENRQYTKSFWCIYICFMFGRDFMGIQENATSQVKTFSFRADLGISIGKLMIDSGKIVWIWNKIREYILWQNFMDHFFFYLGFFHVYSRFTVRFSYSSLPFPPASRHSDISQAITTESSPLHLACSRTQPRSLWFPSTSY